MQSQSFKSLEAALLAFIMFQFSNIFFFYVSIFKHLFLFSHSTNTMMSLRNTQSPSGDPTEDLRTNYISSQSEIEMPFQALVPPPLPNTNTDTVSMSKSKKSGPKPAGYRINDNTDPPLTPGGSTRHSFSIAPRNGDRKSLEELTESSKLLFKQGREFLSMDHLHDALNCFGIEYFSVVSAGNVFECSAGPKHNKKKKTRRRARYFLIQSILQENERPREVLHKDGLWV